MPDSKCFSQKVTNLKNDKGEEIQSTPHAQMIFTMQTNEPVCAGSFVRKGSVENNTEFERDN